MLSNMVDSLQLELAEVKASLADAECDVALRLKHSEHEELSRILENVRYSKDQYAAALWDNIPEAKRALLTQPGILSPATLALRDADAVVAGALQLEATAAVSAADHRRVCASLQYPFLGEFSGGSLDPAPRRYL